MSAEIEQLSRDELVELAEDQQKIIHELRGEVRELSARMDAYGKQVVALKTVIAGGVDMFTALDGFGERHNLVSLIEANQDQLGTVAERLQQLPSKPAEQSDTEGRLLAIRKYLVEQAHQQNANIYGADYKEIQALFDGQISDSWASTLMRKAAGTFPEDAEKAKHGFEVAETKPRNKVRVFCDKIEDRSLLRLKNFSEGQ